MGGEEVGERIAAELLARRACELPRDRRLGDDGEGFDRLYVAPLDQSLAWLSCVEIHRAERSHQRGQRLHGRPNDDRLAVRDTALDSACAIGRPAAGRRRSRRVPRIPGAVRARTRRRSRHPSRPGSPSPPRRGAHPAWSPSRRTSRAPVEHLGDSTSTTPPSVSRSLRAASVARCHSSFAVSPPISRTRPVTSTPISRSSAFATAPAATCTAVCLALARSSASRVSSWPYLSAPARSACPGRGSVTGARALPRRTPLRRPRAHPPRPVLVIAVADDERQRRPERPSVP